MRKKDTVALILRGAAEAQGLIEELHQRDPANDTFSQVGLLDGRKIVTDNLDHGEIGVALEHLLYMVHESDIPIDMDLVASLHRLAEGLHVRNHYTDENLARLGVTSAHNVPGRG